MPLDKALRKSLNDALVSNSGKPSSMTRTLSVAEARKYYDRHSAKQDKQGWYEDKALLNMCENAQLKDAAAILEFGCGTGRLAKELLSNRLPETSTYLGLDLSSEMVSRARERIAPFSERADIRLTDGDVRFDVANESHDRVMACYVLDLLSDQDIDLFFLEANRVLQPGGLLCTAGLTQGNSPSSKLVSRLWSFAQSLAPKRVGGCRPLSLRDKLDEHKWSVAHHQTVIASGVPSEILIARRT